MRVRLLALGLMLHHRGLCLQRAEEEEEMASMRLALTLRLHLRLVLVLRLLQRPSALLLLETLLQQTAWLSPIVGTTVKLQRGAVALTTSAVLRRRGQHRHRQPRRHSGELNSSNKRKSWRRSKPSTMPHRKHAS